MIYWKQFTQISLDHHGCLCYSFSSSHDYTNLWQSMMVSLASCLTWHDRFCNPKTCSFLFTFFCEHSQLPVSAQLESSNINLGLWIHWHYQKYSQSVNQSTEVVGPYILRHKCIGNATFSCLKFRGPSLLKRRRLPTADCHVCHMHAKALNDWAC